MKRWEDSSHSRPREIDDKRRFHFAAALAWAQPACGQAPSHRYSPRYAPRKLLAQRGPLSQAPGAMNSSGRPQTCARVLVAAGLFAALSWALLVSVSPQLHARIHADADRADHNCAVTMIASGSYDHAAHTPLVTAPAAAVQFSEIATLTPCWVQSPFLGACIFEHAPPALV
jgi:hypothetical protein